MSTERTLCPFAAEAWTRLIRTEQALVDRVEDELKEAGFPPLAWYDVLAELDRAEGGSLPQQDIQGRTGQAQYNLCRLADRMGSDGLIERKRCLLDGRSRNLAITGKGRALRAAMWPVYAAAIERHVAQRLTPEERRQLADLLAKLLINNGTSCGD